MFRQMTSRNRHRSARFAQLLARASALAVSVANLIVSWTNAQAVALMIGLLGLLQFPDASFGPLVEHPP
jgi:hypothetical protein